MRRSLSALGAAIALVMSIGTPSAMAQSAAAEISILPTDKGVEITGSVVGLANGEVEASMEISKSDPAGTSNLTQGRAVTIGRGERHVIGMTTLSIQPGGRLSVKLSVMQNGSEIATAVSSFGP